MHTVHIALSTSLQRSSHGVYGLQGDACKPMLQMGAVQFRRLSWWTHGSDWKFMVYSGPSACQWQWRGLLLCLWHWRLLGCIGNDSVQPSARLPMWTPARHGRLYHLLGTLHSWTTFAFSGRHRRFHGKLQCGLCGEVWYRIYHIWLLYRGRNTCNQRQRRSSPDVTHYDDDGSALGWTNLSGDIPENGWKHWYSKRGVVVFYQIQAS